MPLDTKDTCKRMQELPLAKKAAAEAGEALADVSVSGDDKLTSARGTGSGVRVLARFKVNEKHCISVFKAISKEDFEDVVKLLPENTPQLPSYNMTYLIARLELHPAASIQERLTLVNEQDVPMADTVGPAVGCLMATFGTNMISSRIFDVVDPQDLKEFAVEERMELWGLRVQIPHNAMCPAVDSVQPVLKDVDAEALKEDGGEAEEQTVTWSPVDRLKMSVGLLYAVCIIATDSDVSCGFCAPRPRLLERWQGAGVPMKEVTSKRLIYPPSAQDFEHCKSRTVAFFLVDEVQDGLRKTLKLLE